MKNYIVYIESGRIVRAGTCVDEQFEEQAFLEGELVIEGQASAAKNLVIEGVVVDKPLPIRIYDLTAEKVLKLQYLAISYQFANITSFTFEGKEYSASQTALNNLTGISGYVSLNNALPPSFPNVWQALDGSVIPVMDVIAFKALYAAMVNQGNGNFIKLAMLEAQVHSATTQEDLEVIEW